MHSPLSGAPATPAWGQYDQTALGFAPEAPSVPLVSDDDDSKDSRLEHGLTEMGSIDNTSSAHPHGQARKVSLLTRWVFRLHTSHGNGRK